MGNVDQEWLNGELDLVVDDLSRSCSSLPREQIQAAVDVASATLVPNASISGFLPLLIQRRARDRLRALVHQRQSLSPEA
jgi:hypothetical protein